MHLLRSIRGNYTCAAWTKLPTIKWHDVVLARMFMGCNHFRNGADWGGSTSRQQESWFSLAAGERLSRRNRPGIRNGPTASELMPPIRYSLLGFWSGAGQGGPFYFFLGGVGRGWGGWWLGGGSLIYPMRKVRYILVIQRCEWRLPMPDLMAWFSLQLLK